MRNASQSGQILLITLLVLSVAVTIGLAMVSRTTTDSSITNQIEESSRAFNAAEAGIELALGGGIAGPTGAIVGSGGTSANYVVSPSSLGGTSPVFVFPRLSRRGETETVWLIDHNIDGTPNFTGPNMGTNPLRICWSTGGTVPAVAISVYYRLASGQFQVWKSAYDPIRDSRSYPSNGGVPLATNNFDMASVATDQLCTSDMSYRVDIPLNAVAAATPVMLRIRPIYADASLSVSGISRNVRTQGNIFDSCGTIGSTPGAGSGVTRCIQVFQQYRSPAAMFDYSLYIANGSL